MLLSIIVPVYNGEKKIARCLDSLLRLKEKEVEFLIINDGSTDLTKDIVESYVQRDARFCLINQENSGVSSARNKGLDVCRSKYIGFVDADDEVTEEYNEILDMLKVEDCDLFAFDYLIKTSEGVEKKSRGWFVPGINDKEALYNNYLSGASNNVWSNIYKKTIIQKNKLYFDTAMKMGEDSVFNSQYICYCEKVYYIDKIGYKYSFDDTDSASFKKDVGYLIDFTKMYDSYLLVYGLHKNLKFPTDWEPYFIQTYEILKLHGKNMDKEDNKRFRESRFYQKITSQKYQNWKMELKKKLIIWNIYRIYIP